MLLRITHYRMRSFAMLTDKSLTNKRLSLRITYQSLIPQPILFALVCGITCLISLTSSVRAQSTTSLSINLTDLNEAVVSGATVTVTNPGTGLTRNATTNESGVVQFPQLPPGKYDLRAEQSGFKTIVHEGLELLVNTPVALNLQFIDTGGVSETVTVTGEALINQTDATIGNSFSENQIRQLPIEGRNVVGLLSLQPGVTYTGLDKDGNGMPDPRSGAVNGSRSDQANVTLDGVDVNDQQTGEAFNSVLPVTLDSVQEFRVTTTNPNASIGRSSGGQVSLITKSGTNDFHGSLYEFHRNTIFTSNDFFNNANGRFTETDRAVISGLNKVGDERTPRPKLLRNVFGGSLGGPVMKNRAFFFFNYEGRRDASQFAVTRSDLPSESIKNGVLTYVAASGDTRGTPCPVEGNANRRCGTLTPDLIRSLDPQGIGVNQAMLNFLRTYPIGNDPSLSRDRGLSYTGLRFNAPLSINRNVYIARFDYDVTGDSKHMLTWRGTLGDYKDDVKAPQMPGQSPIVELNNSKGFVAGYMTQLSPTMVNDLRWGFTRQGIERIGSNTPSFTTGFLNYGLFDATDRSSSRKVPVHNFVDDLTIIRGTHTFQTGVNLRFLRNNTVSLSNYFPSYTLTPGSFEGLGRALGDQLGRAGTPYANLPATSDRTTVAQTMMGLLGTISNLAATAQFDTTGQALPLDKIPNRSFAVNEYEFYFQDTWRARSNLTLSLGLRYGLYGVPYETNGYQVQPTVNFGQYFDERIEHAARGIPSNQSPLLGFNLAGPANNSAGFYNMDKNNFAPRVSFAYSPGFTGGVLGRIFGGPSRSSIRAGYSIAYDRIGGSFVNDSDLFGAFGLSSRFGTPLASLGYGLPGGAPAAPRFTGLDSLPSVTSFVPLPTGGFPSYPTSNFAQRGFGVDAGLRTPYSQSWNLTVSRELPGSLTLEMSYVGRVGRKLLGKYDIAAPLNLTDPASGTDYWTMLNGLIDFKRTDSTPTTSPLTLPTTVPYIENIFPGLATGSLSASQVFFNMMYTYDPSWADLIFALDTRNNGRSRFGAGGFFQSQFDSFPIWRSQGSSSYHGGQLMFRKRFSRGTQFDFNYTLSKSIDTASAIESSTRTGGQIANAFAPRDYIAASDFDVRHQLNANWLVELPFGRGRLIATEAPGWLNQIIGGWQANGIFRYRSGFPITAGNDGNWPTNYLISGPGTQVSPIESAVTRGDGRPNLFANGIAAREAFDFTRPGSSGSRNSVRGPRFMTVDFGLGKSFQMPWSEGHRVQFRWETFNLTNTVNFGDRTGGAGGRSADINLRLDNAATFGQINNTTGESSRRVMQLGLRYEF